MAAQIEIFPPGAAAPAPAAVAGWPAGPPDADNAPPDEIGRVIHRSEDYTLRYCGPTPEPGQRVVMTFPDLIHPTAEGTDGWGRHFLAKRGVPVLSLTFREANWYQSPLFFPAIEAARAFLGPQVPVTAYGASMGGYGAILAARRLGADRVVALCPQFSIEPDVTPFERRYRAEAERIGPFIHDISAEMSDEIDYFVIHDPSHSIDSAHVRLFPKPARWRQGVCPGAGHGVLMVMAETGATQELSRLIAGKSGITQLRQAIRAGRRTSGRYLRRMGNLVAQSGRHPAALERFIEMAEERGAGKFARRWRKAPLAAPGAIAMPAGPDEVIVHVGLPKTGSSAIQQHFAREADAGRLTGLTYPIGKRRALPHHDWLSAALRTGDVTQLDTAMATTPGGTLLLSDESVYTEALFADPGAAAALRQRLDGRRLRLIACTRSLGSWKLSFYKQALRNKCRAQSGGSAVFWGRSETFEDFFDLPEMRSLTRQDEMLQRISDLFGARVETLEMSPRRDILTSFLDAVGLKPPPDDPGHRSNPSMSDVDAELMRQANAQGAKAHGLMRLLIEVPDDLSAPEIVADLRRGKRELIRHTAPVFDWLAVEYRPNPPLTYSRRAFETRSEFLRLRAAMLLHALTLREAA